MSLLCKPNAKTMHNMNDVCFLLGVSCSLHVVCKEYAHSVKAVVHLEVLTSSEVCIFSVDRWLVSAGGSTSLNSLNCWTR